MSVERGPGTVRDWMSRDPVTVEPDLAAGRVGHLMRERGIRHVLVMDGDCLAGIVSQRDLARLSGREGPPLTNASPVGRVMTEGTVSVSPDVPLTDAVRQMLDLRIGALPVVEGARPIGIFTRADALEALLAWVEGHARRGG